MNTFNERFSEFLHEARTNPNQLSKILGYESPTKLHRLLKGGLPSFQIICDIINNYNWLNERWFLLGEGQIRINRAGQTFNITKGHEQYAGENLVNESENVQFYANARLKELESENSQLKLMNEKQEKEIARMENIINTLERTLDKLTKY